MLGYIFNIKKFAINDGPGIRTTVFFSGCPLRCWWCHNPESLIENNAIIEKECNHCYSKQITVKEIFDKIIEDQIFYDESGGGVTFSGGEPLMQVEFLKECLKLCKANSINTVIDTSGYSPIESIQKILDFTDLFLFDFKLFDDELHTKYTGVSNILIKENLKYLDSVCANVIIRIPLIPNITDTFDNLGLIANFILYFKNIIKIELLPYNKLAEDKFGRINEKARLGNLETQSLEKQKEIVQFMQSYGINTTING
jgi:pyruvate formate lyase activating enzyme